MLLANFHTTRAPNGVAVEPDSMESAEPTTTSTTAPTQFSIAPSTSTTAPTTSAPPTTAVPRNVVDGPAVQNRWGVVKVRVTFDSSRITNITALKLPGDNSHSIALSRDAEPKLRVEALQAQSANIDIVTGATFTSESYIESLQAALDRAGR